MKYDYNDALAAKYVLGTLDGDERRQFVDALERDPEIRAMTDEWEQRLQGLETVKTEFEPSADLWTKIEAALDSDGAGLPGSTTLRGNDGEWQELIAGVEKKLLYFDKAALNETYLIRFAPGARLPPHDHNTAEECFVVDGDLYIGNLYLKAGDFHVIDAGNPHPEAYSEHGTIIYVRGELRV